MGLERFKYITPYLGRGTNSHGPYCALESGLVLNLEMSLKFSSIKLNKPTWFVITMIRTGRYAPTGENATKTPLQLYWEWCSVIRFVHIRLVVSVQLRQSGSHFCAAASLHSTCPSAFTPVSLCNSSACWERRFQRPNLTSRTSAFARSCVHP